MICIIILYEVIALLAAYVPSLPEHYRKLDSVSHGLYLKPLNQVLQEPWFVTRQQKGPALKKPPCPSKRPYHGCQA